MPADVDPARHMLPENFVAPCLLLLLRGSTGRRECSAERPERRPHELTHAGSERPREAAGEPKATYTILDSLLPRRHAGGGAEAPPRRS